MSMTKPICAAAAVGYGFWTQFRLLSHIVHQMMLVEEGHFNLNTAVSKYIPEFANLKVFVKKNVGGFGTGNLSISTVTPLSLKGRRDNRDRAAKDAGYYQASHDTHIRAALRIQPRRGD